ncbi:uncharacterized protein [Euwallacea similis]|uniref:uncharacterized protein n=1 Tax=Euwallacea similis TaxID=1736056 RepID=UPI00344F4F1D
MVDFHAVFKRCQRVLNILYYVTLGWTTILLFSILFYYDEIFARSRFWHIVLTTAGYVPLMAAGINISHKNDIIGKQCRRLPIHVILLSSSLVSVTLGIGSEFIAKV